MIQTRWGHLNRGYSLLTRVQAIFLDGHLLLEQIARSRSGRFFNFNGTAGLWRRSCIEQSGGWQHDTLSEDLDLSYRAQLAGWKFIFLSDVVTPAELPVDMNGFKSQQHRWTKGSVQTCKKLLPTDLAQPSALSDQAGSHWPFDVEFRLPAAGLALRPFASCHRRTSGRLGSHISDGHSDVSRSIGLGRGFLHLCATRIASPNLDERDFFFCHVCLHSELVFRSTTREL